MPKVKFMIGPKSGSNESLNSLNNQSNNCENNKNDSTNDDNRSPNSPDSTKSDLARYTYLPPTSQIIILINK